MARHLRWAEDPLDRELLELRRLIAARTGDLALPRDQESADQFYDRARRTRGHTARRTPGPGAEEDLRSRKPLSRPRFLWLLILLATLLAALAVGAFASARLVLPRGPVEAPSAEAPHAPAPMPPTP